MPRSPHGTCLAFQSLWVRDGKLVKATGYGYANVETRAKATADSLYVIASMTKAFTVAAVLMLADDGKLSLQDPVAHYIDSAPVAWKYVTVSHLLRHTSGTKNMPELADWDTTVWDTTVRNDATPEEIVKAASALALDFPLGLSSTTATPAIRCSRW